MVSLVAAGSTGAASPHQLMPAKGGLAQLQEAYASWPFRLWVVSRTAVLFKPMPRGATYDLNELEDFLRQYVAGRRD